MAPQLRGHSSCIFIRKRIILAGSKYSVFSKSKNPFNKNVKIPPASFKKGSVMFDEDNSGIITSAKTYVDDYYDIEGGLGYYDIENNSTYYRNLEITTNTFQVNYIQNK